MAPAALAAAPRNARREASCAAGAGQRTARTGAGLPGRRGATGRACRPARCCCRRSKATPTRSVGPTPARAVAAQQRGVNAVQPAEAGQQQRPPTGLLVWKLSDRAMAGARKLGHLNPQTQEFTIGRK